MVGEGCATGAHHRVRGSEGRSCVDDTLQAAGSAGGASPVSKRGESWRVVGGAWGLNLTAVIIGTAPGFYRPFLGVVLHTILRICALVFVDDVHVAPVCVPLD